MGSRNGRRNVPYRWNGRAVVKGCMVRFRPIADITIKGHFGPVFGIIGEFCLRDRLMAALGGKRTFDVTSLAKRWQPPRAEQIQRASYRANLAFEC